MKLEIRTIVRSCDRACRRFPHSRDFSMRLVVVKAGEKNLPSPVKSTSATFKLRFKHRCGALTNVGRVRTERRLTQPFSLFSHHVEQARRCR